MRRPIKLSTAIRKGIRGLPQCHEAMFSCENDKPIASCALGSALMHITDGEIPILMHEFLNEFQFIDAYGKEYQINERTVDGQYIEEWVTAKNDYLGWSRTKIARELKSKGF